MKHSLLSLSLVAALVMTACASPPTAPLGGPLTPQQITDQAGQRLQEITLARRASTQLAVAGKITWAQDDAVQTALTLIRANLTQAERLGVTNPAQAAQLLADALAALAKYQGAQP